MDPLTMFLIAIALAVVSYMIVPKPKVAKPTAATDVDGPTADAGRPIPVVFGTITVKGLNTLWSGEVGNHEFKVKP